MSRTAANIAHSQLASSPDDFKLLVGVGIDGTAVVLSILYGNDVLVEDISKMDLKVALWPSTFPQEEGIYLFSGYSKIQHLDATHDDVFKEVFHYATYQKIIVNYKPSEFSAATSDNRQDTLLQ